MSINSELQRLDAVRDALVESVNSKGGSLPEDATLWQVKAGVDAIEQGGGGGGVDTSNLSATPEDVLEGKTFYGKDSAEPQTGTIPVHTALPDLTPVLTNAGSLLGAQIYTPVGKLKKGYYDIEVLEDTLLPPTLTIPTSEINVYDGVTEQGDQAVFINCNQGYIMEREIVHKISMTPVVPDTCVAYLNHRGFLRVRTSWMIENNVQIGGSTGVIDTGSEWSDFHGLGGGALDFDGALSVDGFYIEWDGFSDLTKKYTIHSLIGSTSATSDVYAWGFDQQDSTWEDNYEISGLEMYWHTAGECLDGAGVSFSDGWHRREILRAGLLTAAFTWDGPGNVAVNLITARSDRYKRTLMSPYDEEMMMPGTKYIVGNKLYLGKPPRYTNGTSGAAIGGFALEVGSSGYTDGASYISPLLDGTYKNL